MAGSKAGACQYLSDSHLVGTGDFSMLLMHTSHFGFALSFWLTVCFLASLASGALLGVSADQKISDRFTKLLLGSHIVMSCIATGFAVAHGMMSVWFS